MQSMVMLSVIYKPFMLSVKMLSVVAPHRQLVMIIYGLGLGWFDHVQFKSIGQIASLITPRKLDHLKKQ